MLLSLSLAWPTWLAARNGVADLHARPAIDYLQSKRLLAYDLSDAEWQAVQHSVARADQLMPGNPRFLETLGWLHQLRPALFADTVSPAQQDAHALIAAEYFRRAVDSRPTWSYSWGNLALEHYRRGDVRSHEYRRALANVARFGPWKNDAQRLVLDLGSATWGALTPNVRRAVLRNTERALHRQPGNTLRIVQSHGAWLAMCAAAQNDATAELPHLAVVCAEASFAAL